MSSKFFLLFILIASLCSLSGSYNYNYSYDKNVYCGQTFRRINAAFRGPNNYDYIFVDDRFVISGATGTKAKISKWFKDLQKVDAAAYSRSARTIYFLEDQKIWEFSENFEKIKNSPSIIDIGPRFTRASLVTIQYLNQELVLLIKQLKYWLLFPTSFRARNQEIGFETINIFSAIPRPLDAALSDGNKTALFLSGSTCTQQVLKTEKSVIETINSTHLLKCRIWEGDHVGWPVPRARNYTGK